MMKMLNGKRRGFSLGEASPYHDADGKYSAVREIRLSSSELHDGVKYAESASEKASSVLRFIVHMLHVLVRTVWRCIVGVVVIALACCILAVVGLGFVYFTSADELPNIDDYTKVSIPQDSTIYDVDGEVIGVVSSVHRDNVGFGEISQPMKDAIVSIEDERFYNHQGVDFQGIARALYVNYEEWRSGGDSTSQGASTITQQYVRNAYKDVGSEQTVSRKLTEMMLAAQLEAEMSKDDILNSYLNTVYFGNGCYGVEAASEHYFGHSASELDYYESAVLASIVNAPSIYNLETDDGCAATSERANLVLDKMYSLGKLGDMSQDDLRVLKSTDISSLLHISVEQKTVNQPYYYDYVMKELNGKYSEEDVESGGWQIYTTLSIKDGQAADDIVKAKEKQYSGSGITAALVDIDNDTGAVHAFCGGTDYDASQYNIATDGHLQTGSTLKPIVYAGLCEYKGWYMSDSISAEPINIGTDAEPHMITPYVSGSTATLKQGIVASDNAVTVHVALEEGMDNVKRMVSAVGMDTQLEDNVVSVIGGQTNGFTPLELASGYSTIERGGQAKKHWCITQITDGLGNQVYKHEDEQSYAMSREVSLQVIDAMKSAVDDAGWYNIPFDKEGWSIAAKTGTTNDDMDSWCVGFDHNRTVALWVGGRDAKVTVPNSSHNTTKSFSDYFEKVGQDDSKDDWDAPQYKTQVPELSDGESLQDYVSDIQSKQLTASIQYVSADNAANNQIVGVVNQGEMVDRGGAAVIQVARDMVAVPNFASMTPSEAYDASDGLDINWDVTYSTSGSTIPVVTSQSESAGSVVARGSSITLGITILIDGDSDNRTIQQVPVSGSGSALSMLQDERDALKQKNDELSAKVDELSANGNSDDSEEDNASKVPNVSGLSAGEARRVLSSLGFSVSYSGGENDIISSTSPSAGAVVSSGSSVALSSNDNSSSASATNDSSSSRGQSSSSSGSRSNRNVR